MTNRFVRGEKAPLQHLQDERPKAQMCEYPNCRTRYPGRGRPKLQGFADVAFTAPDGTPVALCCEHYDELLYRAGQGRFSEITGRQSLMTLDLVKAHWQRLDTAASQRARLPLEDFPHV